MPVHTTCLSLVCAVGAHPAAAAAAMRAGLAAFVPLRQVDAQGVPLMGGQAATVDPDARGSERLLELLVRALQDVRMPPDLPHDMSLESLPVFLCTREPQRPGPRLDGLVLEAGRRLGFTLRRDQSAHVARGAVAVFEALAHARQLLAGGSAPGCLVVAVDTLLDARTLAWLDETRRLKTSERSDGILPGEAAGVLLVTAAPCGSSPLTVHGLGFADEPATVLNDLPFLGKGMAQAARGALSEAGLAMHDIGFRLSDVAGESYAFEEVALAQSRLTRQPRATQDLWHPASFIGDCGAASGLVQLAWAEQAFARGYAPGSRALAHASAPHGARAAATLGP